MPHEGPKDTSRPASPIGRAADVKRVWGFLILTAVIVTVALWIFGAFSGGGSSKSALPTSARTQVLQPEPREVVVSQTNSVSLVPNTWTLISNPVPYGWKGEVSWQTPDGFLWMKKPGDAPSKAARLKMGLPVNINHLGENNTSFDVLSERGGVVFMKIKRS